MMLYILVAMGVGALTIFVGTVIMASSRSSESKRRHVGEVVTFIGAFINLAAVAAVIMIFLNSPTMMSL